jgi:hypothetical protein
MSYGTLQVMQCVSNDDSSSDDDDEDEMTTMGAQFNALTINSVTHLQAPELANRTRQIQALCQSSTFERPSKMRDDEIWEIARFIEQKIIPTACKTAMIFLDVQFNLPRTLLANKEWIFIFSQNEKSAIQGNGGSKKVTTAIQVPLNPSQSASLVACLGFSHNGTRPLANPIPARDKEFTFATLLFHKSPKYFLRPYAIIHYFAPLNGCDISLETRAIFDLGKQLQPKQLSQQQRYQLVKDILHGIHEMHKVEICHGDLKQGNILISADGVGKIIDFGTTLSVKDPQNDAPRTCFYRAPELLTDAFEGDVFPTDMYSAGLLVMEILNPEQCFQLESEKPRHPFYKLGVTFCCESEKQYANLLRELVPEFITERHEKYLPEISLQIDPFSEKQKIEQLNTKQRYEFLMLNLTQYDPKLRWTSEMAVKFCDQYL